jgi:hypothetical protein
VTLEPNQKIATTLRPTDLRSVRDALLDTAGTVSIAGAGTAADWAGPLEPVETALDTTGLTGVITHNPGDMTRSPRSWRRTASTSPTTRRGSPTGRRSAA